MKKQTCRLICLLLTAIMIFGLLPETAMAESRTTNETTDVTIEASYFNGYFVVPRDTITATSDMAEQYGYKDKEGAVTALDVLIAIHQKLYETDFTKENASAYLNVSQTGFLTNVFGDGIGNVSVAVNGTMPCDKNGEYNKSYGGYTAFSIPDTVVSDGDVVEFFSAQDSYYMDNYTWFETSGNKTESINVNIGDTFEMTLNGYMFTYCGGYNILDLAENTEPIEGAQLAIVDKNNGKFEKIAEKETDSLGKVSLSFDKEGIYIVSAYIPDENYSIPIYAPWCVVTVTTPDTEITIPNDAELFVGSKTKHYVPFTEEKAVTSCDNEDGTTTYYFDLSNKNVYNYRVSGENYVTYAGKFSKTSEPYSLNVTKDLLQPEGESKTTIDRNVTSNGGYNVADVYMNINPQGYLKLKDVGSTYQLVNLRNWEIVDTTVNNYFIEPDYHYTVINENGEADNSVVTVSDNGFVKAVGNGTAIVLVTYDSITAYDDFYGAIWPENTGVFVVSVGAGESGIITGMTINEGKNVNADTGKKAMDALDAEHDVIYFSGDTGSYVFAPVTEGCTVSVANPSIADNMSFNGFTNIKADENSFTVPLKHGRNIVKIEKNGKCEYQVITAKKLNYVVNGGKPVVAGDTLSVVFDTLYHPANKLAGVYNMNAYAVYYTADGKTIGGNGNQYAFASNTASQTIGRYINRTETSSSWGKNISYKTGDVFKVDDNFNGDSINLTEGAIVVLGYGDPYGNHRGITLENGKAPNMNASVKEGILGTLPDIEIPVTALDSISIETQPTVLTYNVGEKFNSDGMVVKANYANGESFTVTDYVFSDEAFTGNETKVTVSYTQGNVTKTGDVDIVIKNADDSSKNSVVKRSGGGGGTLYVNNTENITVSFTLLGDKNHGEPTEETGTHTLRDGNLETWIPKTSVMVPEGSKVIDVITQALKQAGVSYENPTGNYIKSIRDLEEFTNGSLSGWMYTLNGEHPSLGIDEQTLKNGDVIVFHYSDDYTREMDTEGLNSSDEINEHASLNVSGEQSVGELNSSSNSSGIGSPNVTSVNETGLTKEEALDSIDSTNDVKTDDNVEKNSKNDEFDYSASKDEIPFADVAVQHWARDAIRYAYENNLMNGVNGDRFEPEGLLNRAMLVTILYNMENKPDVKSANSFTDVSDGEWYANSVIWAAENNIISGYGNDLFGPLDAITREQMAKIFYTYAQFKNFDCTKSSDLAIFTDVLDISEWALSALKWANAEGLINGRTSTCIAPKGNAKRAEAAMILKLFNESVAK